MYLEYRQVFGRSKGGETGALLTPHHLRRGVSQTQTVDKREREEKCVSVIVCDSVCLCV